MSKVKDSAERGRRGEAGERAGREGDEERGRGEGARAREKKGD